MIGYSIHHKSSTGDNSGILTISCSQTGYYPNYEARADVTVRNVGVRIEQHNDNTDFTFLFNDYIYLVVVNGTDEASHQVAISVIDDILGLP